MKPASLPSPPYTKTQACLGFDPGTSPILSKNHIPRSTNQPQVKSINNGWNSISFHRLSLQVRGWCYASCLRVSGCVHLGFILKIIPVVREINTSKLNYFAGSRGTPVNSTTWAVLPAFLFWACSQAGHSPVVWTDTLRLLFKFSLCSKKLDERESGWNFQLTDKNWLTSRGDGRVDINKRSWCN